MELFDMLKTRIIIHGESGVPVLSGTWLLNCTGLVLEITEMDVISGTAETEE